MTKRNLTVNVEMTQEQVIEACQEWCRDNAPGWKPGPVVLHVAEQRHGPREDFGGYEVTAKVAMSPRDGA